MNERNFSRRHVAGFVGGPIFYPFADVAALRSENTSDKKSTFHILKVFSGVYNIAGDKPGCERRSQRPISGGG